MFITVHTAGSIGTPKPVHIRADHITAISPNGKTSYVHTIGSDDAWHVSESAETILKMIAEKSQWTRSTSFV